MHGADLAHATHAQQVPGLVAILWEREVLDRGAFLEQGLQERGALVRLDALALQELAHTSDRELQLAEIVRERLAWCPGRPRQRGLQGFERREPVFASGQGIYQLVHERSGVAVDHGLPERLPP